MKLIPCRKSIRGAGDRLAVFFLLLVDGLETILLPGGCFACGGELSGGDPVLSGLLCVSCRRTVRLAGADCCSRCGEFPKRRKKKSRGADADPHSGCPRCEGRSFGFVRSASGAAYSGAVRDLVHRLKFSGDRRAAVPLGRLARLGAEQALGGARPDVVTAVPLHPLKRIRRGYNQAELIARIVAHELSVPYKNNLVKRVRNTPSQGAGLNAERRANMIGAFRPGRRLRRLARAAKGDSSRAAAEPRERYAAGVHVLLIDDVLSTGATLDHCARALKEGGAFRVTGATAAT